jgi:predicted nuclease with TOPRIM domain
MERTNGMDVNSGDKRKCEIFLYNDKWFKKLKAKKSKKKGRFKMFNKKLKDKINELAEEVKSLKGALLDHGDNVSALKSTIDMLKIKAEVAYHVSNKEHIIIDTEGYFGLPIDKSIERLEAIKNGFKYIAPCKDGEIWVKDK